ncbi:MAG: MarR family winged helix-turn-helix transcriptional regulator [Candidatus Caccovivens sp.]
MENRFGVFTQLINNISRNIYKLKFSNMEEIGLRSTHVSCLYYLLKKRELTLKELCEKCDENKAAISRTVDDLTQLGYVEKKNVSCKYKVPLVLTEKGEQVGDYIEQRIDELVERASFGLCETDRVKLYDSLRLINNNLQKIVDKEKENGCKNNH